MRLARFVLLVVFSVPAVHWCLRPVCAEIPALSKEELHDAASHAFTARVERTYENKERSGDYEHTHGVAECLVTRVDRGTDIRVGDRAFVRYWREHWIGEGIQPPHHTGHWDVPAGGDTAVIFVKGDRKTGYDVLSPNGFFKVTKTSVPATKPEAAGPPTK